MYQKTTLDNGLRVVTTSMPHTHSVSACFFIGAGSRYEADEEAGVCHFIEHMLFKGTRSRPTSLAIASGIEGVGGTMNAGTDKELTVYWAKVARPHFEGCFDVLADMLLNSLFDPAEIERERRVIVEEIHMSHDIPQQRADILIDELLWPGHSLGRDIAGTTASVEGLGRETMLANLAGYYQPERTVAAVAGDISHRQAVSAVSKALGKWQGQGGTPLYTPYAAEPSRRIAVERRPTEQAHMCLAVPGLPTTHPERFVLDLLNAILGEGMSSRLFIRVRDELGLAYSISSYVEHFHDTGTLTVTASTDGARLGLAISTILGELARLKDDLPEEEVARAREFAKGRLLLRLEDSRSVAGWLGSQEVLTGDILDVNDVVAAIDRITADEIRSLAARLFRKEHLRLAVVGPVEDADRLAGLLSL